MMESEAAKVLTKAAAFDQRTIGAGDVAAWHEALADVDFGDALAAVTVHYRESTDRLMPAHVRRIVGDWRRERLSGPEPVPAADPDDVPAYLAELRANRAARARADSVMRAVAP